MEKVTLKLYEIYNLESELTGIKHPETGEQITKGILPQVKSFAVKYWLLDLFNKVQEEKKPVEKLREELIKTYGEEDENGSIGIAIYLDGKNKEVNPKFIKYSEEFNSVLNQEKEIEYKPLTLEQLKDIEDENYVVFMKLVKP
jgi:hypothetical protein